MITVNKNDFLNAIRAVKSSCSKGDLNPILNTINIQTVGQGVQLTTTNLINSARTIIEANVTEQIDICVNADKLENIINALDDIITIDCPDNIAIIKSGNTYFEIVVLLSNEFPKIEFELSKEKIILSKDEFVKGVNKTIISTASENQNLLNGVCFTSAINNYEMAATDGNRLSLVKFDTTLDKEGQFVIPHAILVNVIKCIQNNVEIYFEDKKVIFKTGNYLYSTNLLQGVYPKYNQLIPKNQPLKAVVDRNKLLKSLEKVAIMSDERTNITVFNFKDNKLDLTTACDGGKAEDTIEVSFDGEFKIAFNFRFILDGIKAMQSNVIEFNMSDKASACVLNGDFTYLVMPINIRK